MIASIQGSVVLVATDYLVIATYGVGYKVFVAHGAFAAGMGDDIFAHTSMIVREDSLTLYGFPTPADRDLFELLISVSGIGPKTGLAILSTLTIDHLRNAVASGQPEVLTRVPGIGKKTAEKMILDLRDKLKGADGLIGAGTGFEDYNRDVIDALIGLGYSITEAQTALSALPKDAPKLFDERLRMALQYFV
ncbi:MAG: Holliday junction branch migration protein RuvA [Chloroflexota bacterium]|nr:Holliday junction branch migration protein RuvA [Chloroflexota bacterium]